MRFARIRSDMAETFHDVSAIAVDVDGGVLFASGDTTATFYHRSAIKPFQALAARRCGLTLPPEHLALTCASHGGYPVHLAIVDAILTDHGLDRSALGCTPDLPLAQRARSLQAGLGHRLGEPRFHNCSGKHAGWLAACVIAGWETDTYLDPEHPIQRSVTEVVAEVTGTPAGPVGVDGCGAPTIRGDVGGLARAFARLSSDPELAPIADAMTRFGALVADNVRGDGRIATTWGGPVKVGAEGLFAMARQGIGIATKSWDGSSDVAAAAALEVADRIGALPPSADAHLADVRRPPVLGGGRPVGTLSLVEV